MKFIAILIVVVVIALAIIVPQFAYTVDETEIAIVTQFGQIQKEVTSPGLNFKTPFVQNVTRFDKRLLLFDAPPDSILTKDKKRLIVDVYARGRIVDPTTFREKLGNVQTATDRAVDIIASELRSEVANHIQSEIITTQRDAMMANVLNAVTPKLREFGIEVIDVRIKRADFPSEIAESVYSRMQSERKRKADKERAEGSEVDAQVRADADRKATIIIANAQRDSRIITGCGDAESTLIFAKALNTDPEFYSFQRSLEASKSILSNTTVVMPVTGFAEVFDQIRKGIDQASVQGEYSADTADLKPDNNAGMKCAEVSAAWYLAAELKVDQPDITFTSIKQVTWPNVSLGCVPASIDAIETSVQGFEVDFIYENSIHKVRSNQYGSLLAICE
jgi:membrane protease subunit HflC